MYFVNDNIKKAAASSHVTARIGLSPFEVLKSIISHCRNGKPMTNYQSIAGQATEHNDMFYIITQTIKDFKWMHNEFSKSFIWPQLTYPK